MKDHETKIQKINARKGREEQIIVEKYMFHEVCQIATAISNDDRNEKALIINICNVLIPSMYQFDGNTKEGFRALEASLKKVINSVHSAPNPCSDTSELFKLTRSLMLVNFNGYEVASDAGNTGLYLNMRRELYGERVLDCVFSRAKLIYSKLTMELKNKKE